MDASEAELKEFNSEITLEKREMWKCGSEMDRKKARMKETKVELNKQQKTGEKLKNDVNGLKDTKISCNNRALTAEEKANQMQRYWIFFCLSILACLRLWSTKLENKKWADFCIKVTRFKGNSDVFFEMEKCRADKNWAQFYKIRGFKY